ncbi:hypothetical protein RND71_013009 [Anisodus tanguticus]|uniref:Reverse transcriptase Ty1/copia-type domain-containing protein n=1 Tax=Anisodus tanguticus TaxID=243964 RepID=A0AAE1VHH8_9SOLA|nr:hypothetical protein RND71_013009 [Anisodus tanguticus]
MNDEMKFMYNNGVWDIIELPQGNKSISCKRIYKTKKDNHENIERFKPFFVAKSFSQKEKIDYQETFSPVSTKDAFRIIMTLMAHFDIELHPMNVKTFFLNRNLFEEIYMKQPDDFVESEKEHLMCKLKKSIYGQKQASRQWYLRFII